MRRLLVILVLGLFAFVLRASALQAASDPRADAELCAEVLRRMAPHLFQENFFGVRPLTTEKVARNFRSSLFENHPEHERASPQITGSDSRRMYRADWWIIGDQQNIHLDFGFEKQKGANGNGPNPHVRVSFSRRDPLVWRVRTHLQVGGKQDHTLDLNLLSQVSSVMTNAQSVGTRWSVGINDSQVVQVLAQLIEERYGQMNSGEGSDLERFLREMDEVMAGEEAHEQPVYDALFGYRPALHRSARGELWVLCGSLEKETQAFLENDLVSSEEVAPDFQDEAWRRLRKLPWIKALLPKEMIEGPGRPVKVIPILTRNLLVGFDGLSFVLEVDFGF